METKNLKPFTLKGYKEGRQIFTRDGRPVRIICTTAEGSHPIIALLPCETGELPDSFTINGKYFPDNMESSLDLVMSPIMHTRYANVYKNDKGEFCLGILHESKEEAENNIIGGVKYLGVTKIVIEE